MDSFTHIDVFSKLEFWSDSNKSRSKAVENIDKNAICERFLWKCKIIFGVGYEATSIDVKKLTRRG